MTHTYSRAEIRDGTGFPKGARFVMVGEPTAGNVLAALENIAGHADQFLDDWSSDDGMNKAERADAAEAKAGHERDVTLLRQFLNNSATIAIVVKGGVVESVYSDAPARFVLVDRDNIAAGDVFTGESEPTELSPEMVAQFVAGNDSPPGA